MKKIMHRDGLESYTQYINNLNMAPYYKPLVFDVIYLYCKVALSEVEKPEELESLVCDYVLSMQQQQASDDEIY